MNNRKEYTQKWWKELKADPEKLRTHYDKQNKWRNANPDCAKQSFLKSKKANPENYLFSQAKSRARLKGHEFNIELSDIKIPQRCPIMDEVLEWIPHGFHPYSPSIDRIDSSKGYIKGNVWVISSLANRMKWNATKEQLLTFCQGVMSLEGRSGPC